MLIIGICDGDTAVRVMLSDYINRYRQDTGLNIKVLSYDTGEKLTTHYPLDMDLIFLEIPFMKMNGIEIARHIRKLDPNVSIIFLTSVLNHVLEAYEVKANNYLIKPLKYERFLQEVEQARLRHGQNRFFLEKNINGIYKVYTKSIIYIETKERDTLIHTEGVNVLSHRRMKEHEVFLFEPYFVRCHTGFIVNLYFFQRLEGNDIILINGEHIPVSRGRRANVMEKIELFYEEETKK